VQPCCDANACLQRIYIYHIEPSDKGQHVLGDLLSGIYQGNTHDEVSFGRPVGKEAL